MLHKLGYEAIDCPECGVETIAHDTRGIIPHLTTQRWDGLPCEANGCRVCEDCGGTGCETCNGKGFLT